MLFAQAISGFLEVGNLKISKTIYCLNPYSNPCTSLSNYRWRPTGVSIGIGQSEKHSCGSNLKKSILWPRVMNWRLEKFLTERLRSHRSSTRFPKKQRY